MPSSKIGIALPITAVTLLLLASPAFAAPVTIDFESGAAPNEQVRAQYCCPGGVDKGPTFLKATDAGFDAGSAEGLSGLVCEPPSIDAEDQTSSGTRAIRLIGCPGSEFAGSAAFFHLSWPTDSVEFQVGLAAETPSSCTEFICAEIWTTAFDEQGNVLQQQQTLLGPNTKFKGVPLISGSDNIAFVAIERGSRSSPSDSDTGVVLAGGIGYLVVDDLTYDPPSSPPESSFRLGAAPASTRLAPGTESPQIKIPVTWTANPDPSASPVSLELTAPPGITGTFTPNPTNTGEAKLILEAEKGVEPPANPEEELSVTVDGYVDKGGPSEKHASVQIPIEITEPFTLDKLTKYTVSRCTPVQVPIRIPKDPGITDPFEVDVFITSGNSQFIGTSAGSIESAHHVRASLSQPGNEAQMTVTVGIDVGAEPEAANSIRVRVAPSGYAARESTGSIAVEPIRFDTISPGTADAPQRGIPGTLMTVKGAGFCPGDKVAIGPPEDTANPDSISTPGNTMTFRVPRGAVGGPLRILRLKGNPITGPQVPVSSFRNTRSFSWKNEDYGMQLSGEMMDELFGKEETNINVSGWLIRKPEAGLLGEATNKFIHGGICFGMAFGVAQMFDSPNWVDEFPHGAHSVWGLEGPSKPSNALLRFVTERFSLQFSDEVIPMILGQVLGQSVNAHDPSADIDEIRSLIGPGKPPLLLGMVSWKEGFGAHTVIAYDTEPGPNDTTIVYVYNPNSPYAEEEANAGKWGTHTSREFTQSQIIVRNTDSHWEFAGLGWEGADNNLLIFPHDKLPILDGKAPHVPNIAAIAAIDAFGAFSDAVTQVSDDAGNRLLEKGEPAKPKDWPAGIAPFSAFTGATGSLQAVLADTNKAGSITATVKRGKRGGAMELAVPGTRASLEAGVHPGQVDHVTVDDRAGEIGYEPGRTTPFGGTLISGPGGAGSSAAKASASERMADFQTTSPKGGGDTVSFERGREFTIDQAGGGAGLSLTLSGFGADGLPVAVRLPRAHLAGGERLSAAPSNWRRLGSAPIRVGTTVHGRTTTHLVKGRRLGRSFAALRGAKLDAGGSGVALKLRLKHPPKGAAISPVVEVFRGSKVIAKSKPASFSGGAMARPSVLLSRPLGGGGFTLRVRLLETVPSGLAQGSTVVRKSLKVQVGR